MLLLDKTHNGAIKQLVLPLGGETGGLHQTLEIDRVLSTESINVRVSLLLPFLSDNPWR